MAVNPWKAPAEVVTIVEAVKSNHPRLSSNCCLL